MLVPRLCSPSEMEEAIMFLHAVLYMCQNGVALAQHSEGILTPWVITPGARTYDDIVGILIS